MTPILGELSIGNDYVTYSIDQQLALQYSLERGTFPLFAPGFAGGHSAAALTLGQLYHPLSHLAALMPGYWEGNALTVNTVIKLTSIGLTHLLVFVLLVRLKLKAAIAFAISFITVYNLRMLDMFRYGASLENYLGFILFAALSPLIALFQKQVPKIVYVLFGAALLVFLISLGGETPLHFVFWKIFPLADSFRTPGRINLILPILLSAYFFVSQ